jgi:hypothetical protein
MRGVPLKTVQELLGHATIEMTMRYAHLSSTVKHDAIAVLDSPSLERGKVNFDGTIAAHGKKPGPKNEKSPGISRAYSCGVDGTRTRGLRRDRPAL